MTVPTSEHPAVISAVPAGPVRQLVGLRRAQVGHARGRPGARQSSHSMRLGTKPHACLPSVSTESSAAAVDRVEGAATVFPRAVRELLIQQLVVTQGRRCHPRVIYGVAAGRAARVTVTFVR